MSDELRNLNIGKVRRCGSRNNF